MAGYTTVNAFFDESGKFRDHNVVCFGGVAGYGEHVAQFSREWGGLLARNGMKKFSAKDAFNHRRPLGTRNKALGPSKRVAALRPFIQCIRKNLGVVVGIVVDVPTFKTLPSHVHNIYGNDPIFMAFLRALLHVLDYTPSNDRISFICDDEEALAIPFYRLYRKIKKVWPDAKRKLSGISFVDDTYLWGLQAADLVAGLMRLETGCLWFKQPYNYKPLFKQLTSTPTVKSAERIWHCDIAFVGKKNLLNVAAGIKDEWIKATNEEKHASSRQN